MSLLYLFVAISVALFGLSFVFHLSSVLFGPRRYDHELRGVLALAMALFGCFVLGYAS